MDRLPDAQDVIAADRRIRAQIGESPLWLAPDLEPLTGAKVYLKLESLQPTGSFKIRGALNRLAQLTDQQRARGVVAWSSGNHAQGVALAARMVGTRATIVMPADAPAVKIAGTRRLGATIVPYDRATEDREAIALRIAERDGLIVVPAFDDADVIAGQGTVGLEIARQATAAGVRIDDIYAPVSGGGLIAGIATALRDTTPRPRLYAVEPEGFDDHGRSLRGGQIVRNASGAAALCDGLLASAPGRLTWPINREALSGAFAVSDEDVMAAVAVAFHRLKLVVEPSGAAALAALLAGKHHSRGRVAVAVISGGNVDAVVFLKCLAGGRNDVDPAPALA